MPEQTKRILTSDPMPRKEVALPPMLNRAQREGVGSSGSEVPKKEEAQSALSGLSFSHQ